MIFYLLATALCLTYSVKGTALTISGTGAISQSEVLSNCDITVITSITIEEGITSLGSLCFFNFPLLINISLPSTVQTVDPTSTRYCYAFTNWFLDSSNTYLELDNYGALYYKGKETLIRLPPRKTSYIFPSTVKTILSQAFQGQRVITTLTIPNTVTTLNGGMIYDSVIQSVIFESGSTITTFPSSAFAYCSIRKIFIPSSMQTISSYCFQYTAYLSTVIFEEGSNLQTISSYAFYRSGIANFTFPPKMTTLQSYVFNIDSKLTNIYIPASLTSIDPQAFTGCSSITSIRIDDDNPVYSVVEPATLMNKNQTTILYTSPAATSMYLPATVTSISSTLLQSCTSLTDVTVNASNKVYSAQDGILYNYAKTTAIACAGGITDAKLVSTCKTIGAFCFYMMTNLVSVSIPSVLTTVETYAFFANNKF